MIEEINKFIKEDAKSKKFETQNIQEIWDSVKRPSLRTIRIEEDVQLTDSVNIFNKILGENFLILKKEMPIKHTRSLQNKIYFGTPKKSIINVQKKEY